MKQKYTLIVAPNATQTEATLIGCQNELKDAPSTLLESLPKYIGVNYIKTNETVIIDYGYINEKKIPITQIKSCSFSHCKNVKTIHIANHITNIEWNMLGCENLENIEVDIQNEHYISIDGVLFSKDKKSLVGFPSGREGEYSIPQGTIRINNCAFKSSKLSHLHIPKSVEHIGTNVFYECKNLKEIIIPTTLRHIEPNCNRQNKPITQTFYYSSDTNREHPITIQVLLTKLGNNR